MQRRDVLKTGTVVGVGALEACAPQRPPLEPGVMPPDMHGFLSDLDRRMDEMGSADFVRGFTETAKKRPLTDAERNRLAPHDKLFRGMLRTLYLTQTFRDLPEEAQMHPGMQHRMHHHLGEVNQTVVDVTDLLAKLDDTQRQKLQQHLRKDPDLAMKIAEAIDDQAGTAGVSNKRRLQLRSMMMQASFRLKNTSPGVVIDEYVEKARRLGAESGMHTEMALRIAGRTASDSFWDHQATYTALGGQGDPSIVDPAAPSTPLAPAPVSPHKVPGMSTINTGIILMGIGVVVFGLSYAIVSAGAFPLVVGMTVGAVMFAVGFICLIVGALINAFSND